MVFHYRQHLLFSKFDFIENKIMIFSSIFIWWKTIIIYLNMNQNCNYFVSVCLYGPCIIVSFSPATVLSPVSRTHNHHFQINMRDRVCLILWVIFIISLSLSFFLHIRKKHMMIFNFEIPFCINSIIKV